MVQIFKKRKHLLQLMMLIVTTDIAQMHTVFLNLKMHHLLIKQVKEQLQISTSHH